MRDTTGKWGVSHSNRQPRIVILSPSTVTLSKAKSLRTNSAKDLGSHSLYSEILRLRLRMTREGPKNDPLVVSI